jgi:WD40 repeat protein
MSSLILRGHKGPIHCAEFSPDGKQLASASNDHTVRVWNVESAQQVECYRTHNDWVRAVAYSPDGKRLASAGDDDRIFFWNLATQQCIHEHVGNGCYIYKVVFAQNGKTLTLATSDNQIYHFDLVKSTWQQWRGHTSLVADVAYSPDSAFVASASYDATLRVWEVATGQCRRMLENPGICAITFSRNGTQLAASNQSTILVWDFPSFQPQRLLHNGLSHDASRRVFSIVYTLDDKYIVAGTEDRYVVIWDVTRGVRVHTLCGHTEMVRHVALSPDGKSILSTSHDHTIRIWPLFDRNRLAAPALALLQLGVAPYVVLDILDFIFCESSIDCESHYWHREKILLIERLQQKIKIL